MAIPFVSCRCEADFMYGVVLTSMNASGYSGHSAHIFQMFFGSIILILLILIYFLAKVLKHHKSSMQQ